MAESASPPPPGFNTPGIIRGIVRDEKGNPVLAASVTVLGRDFKVNLFTNEFGQFSVGQQLPTGEYFLYFSDRYKRGLLFPQVKAKIPSDDVRAPMQIIARFEEETSKSSQLNTISGSATDDKTYPIPAVSIRIDGKETRGARTDNMGHFEVHYLPDGNYVITPFHRLYSFTPIPLSLEGGGVHTVNLLGLSRNKKGFLGRGNENRITGYVFDKNDKPLKGIKINIQGTAYAQLKKTNGAGFFSSGILSKDAYLVSASDLTGTYKFPQPATVKIDGKSPPPLFIKAVNDVTGEKSAEEQVSQKKRFQFFKNMFKKKIFEEEEEEEAGDEGGSNSRLNNTLRRFRFRMRPAFQAVGRETSRLTQTTVRGAVNMARVGLQAAARGAMMAARGAAAAAQGLASAIAAIEATPVGWIITVVLLVIFIIVLIIILFHPEGISLPFRNNPSGTSSPGSQGVGGGPITIPGLTLEKSGPDNVNNGQVIQYTIKATYTGSLDVTITDDIPANTEFVEADGNCTGCTSGTKSVSWKLKDQSGGSPYTFTLKIKPLQNDIYVKNKVTATAPEGGSIASCQFYRDSQLPLTYKSPKLISYFEDAERLSGMPSVILAAIATVESYGAQDLTDDTLSSFKCAESRDGALGLMQIVSHFSHRTDAICKECIQLGVEFLNKALNTNKTVDQLTRDDYCNLKTSIFLAAGFVIKKMGYAYFGDGKTWAPAWITDKNAIMTVARSYYGALDYGNGNYGEDLWNSVSNCKPTSAGIGSGNYTCPLQATFVPFPSGGYSAIGPGQYSYVCAHCWSSTPALPTYNAIDMGVEPSGGTPALAATDGRAELYRSSDGKPGLFLTEADGKSLFYTHIQEFGRVAGEVKKGERVGYVAAHNDPVAKNNGVAHLHIDYSSAGVDHYHPDIPIGPLLDQWCGNSVCNGHQPDANQCETIKANGG